MQDTYTLKEALTSRTKNELTQLLRLTGVSTSASRKADLVKALMMYLQDEHSLGTSWESLDELGRRVVSHAFHNGGMFDYRAFYAQYQESPEWSWGSYRYGRDESPLELFLHKDRIPEDLLPVLSGLVYPKETFRIEGSEELPEVLPALIYDCPSFTADTERIGQHDLVSLLYLASQKELTVVPSSGRLNARSAKKFAELLSHEDFLPWRTPFSFNDTIRPFGLHKFAEQGGFLRRGKLTKKGKAYLETRDPELLLEAFEQWTEEGKFDEFERVTGIKGRRSKSTKFSPPAPRREAIIEALSWCPVGVWIDIEDFFRGVLAWGFNRDVEISTYPALYIGHATYGNLYDMGGNSFWQAVNGMYIRVLLFEYLASLGAVDVVYGHPEDVVLKVDDYDFEFAQLCLHQGLLHFRINPLGAYLFGQAGGYKVPESQEIRFSIDEHMKVCWDEGVAMTPLIRRHLEGFSEYILEEEVYKLSEEKVLAGLEQGHPLSAFTDFIDTYHKVPLPDHLTGWLTGLKRKVQSFKKSGTAIVIQVKTAELAKMALADPEISRYAQPFGPKKLVVPSTYERSFKRRLKELDFVLL